MTQRKWPCRELNENVVFRFRCNCGSQFLWELLNCRRKPNGGIMRNSVLSFLVGVALSAGLLCAQEAARGPDGGTTYHVSGVDLLAIPGKAFTAKSTTDWTRILEDGTKVRLHLNANLARDSQGRMYRERRSFVPEGSAQESRLMDIILYDPAALTKTTCTVAIHQCVVTGYRPRTSFVTTPAGAFANGTRYLNREDLGTNTMDGLDVVGTRETLTINAGVAGNERPLVTTREFWYSPDLQTNLSVTRNDPREGLQVVRLSSISRSEPQPQQFEVPSGFTVQDARSSNHTEQ
jgi:hypothetical protein